MERSRVVVGAVNSQQLDVIRRVSAEPDIEVIGPINDMVKLLIAVREMVADVVIISLDEDNAEPGLCSHVLSEYPRVLMLGLSQTSSRIFELTAHISKQEITSGSDGALDAIRMARLAR